MTANEYKRAFALADDQSVDLSAEDIAIFDGYGLAEFKPVTATIRQVARLMRWQAQYLNGRWDNEQLTEIRNLFRNRVIMVG